MCAIFGEINTQDNQAWIDDQKEQAFKRGKDLIEYGGAGYRLFHTRLATNNSPDTYPIILDNTAFAMNGIVSEGKYKKLQTEFDVAPYTVDSAYMLKAWQELHDFSQFDSLDFVFACWLVDGNKIYLANKDFPLYVKIEGEGLRFSSFRGEGMEPLNNRAVVYDTTNNLLEALYDFKNLVYAGVKTKETKSVENKTDLSRDNS